MRSISVKIRSPESVILSSLLARFDLKNLMQGCFVKIGFRSGSYISDFVSM